MEGPSFTLNVFSRLLTNQFTNLHTSSPLLVLHFNGFKFSFHALKGEKLQLKVKVVDGWLQILASCLEMQASRSQLSTGYSNYHDDLRDNKTYKYDFAC